MAAAACDPQREAEARRTRAVADSAAGDSAALATLPPALARELDLRAVLTPAALRDSTHARCDVMAAPKADSTVERRRFRATLADSTRLVLYVRTRRSDGAVRRIELVRRESPTAQRGFIWDAKDDALQSIQWVPNATRPEVTTLPRGGPAPRALRAIGRRLLALPCAGVRRVDGLAH